MSIISLSAILTGVLHSQRAYLVENGAEPVDMPAYAFLLDRGGEAYYFDLGIASTEYYAQHTSPIHHLFRPESLHTIPTDVPSVSLAGCFFSHYHWDHTGDLSLLPQKTKMYVGPGTMEAVKGGAIDRHLIERHEWTELDMVDGDYGGFKRGCDFFRDGSLILLDCPGHCAGHMVARVRVTQDPETCVILGGDTAHDQELLCCSCPVIPSFTAPSGGQISLQEDHAVARESIATLMKYEERDDTMVLLSHEREARGIVTELQPDESGRGAVNDWKAKGWKEAKWKRFAST